MADIISLLERRFPIASGDKLLSDIAAEANQIRDIPLLCQLQAVFSREW